MLTTVAFVFGFICFALGIGALFYGWVFGLVALPTLIQRPVWKYTLLITGMLIPPVCWVVCLMNYSQTRYASRFILGGLALLLAVGAIYLFFG